MKPATATKLFQRFFLLPWFSLFYQLYSTSRLKHLLDTQKVLFNLPVLLSVLKTQIKWFFAEYGKIRLCLYVLNFWGSLFWIQCRSYGQLKIWLQLLIIAQNTIFTYMKERLAKRYLIPKKRVLSWLCR